MSAQGGSSGAPALGGRISPLGIYPEPHNQHNNNNNNQQIPSSNTNHHNFNGTNGANVNYQNINNRNGQYNQNLNHSYAGQHNSGFPNNNLNMVAATGGQPSMDASYNSQMNAMGMHSSQQQSSHQYGMSQMNGMNNMMNNMNMQGMNGMNSMNSMNYNQSRHHHMSQMSQMNQMVPIGMNPMNNGMSRVNPMNGMHQMSGMNQMNPMAKMQGMANGYAPRRMSPYPTPQMHSAQKRGMYQMPQQQNVPPQAMQQYSQHQNGAGVPVPVPQQNYGRPGPNGYSRGPGMMPHQRQNTPPYAANSQQHNQQQFYNGAYQSAQGYVFFVFFIDFCY